MIRPLALCLALAAPAAQACAVAEGCPMGEPPAGGCAVVRVDADHVCIDDPSAPGGVRIVPRGGTVPADAPDCGAGAAGCLMPLPAEPAAPAIPLLGALLVLGILVAP